MNNSIYQINAYIIFALGAPLNLLLIYLIIKKSEREMRQYRLMLIKTASLDLLVLVFDTLFIPVSISVDAFLLVDK
uniref:G-protein coupled receptors family 1 profile domain-containing protein n=1 Tax=Ditylenchus dipsaci TaxID=166011 RepID=A0A915CPT1_9BILA